MLENEERKIDRSIAAAERTLLILDVFADAQRSLTLSELSAATGLFKSVILRYMISLERLSYVRKLADGRYQLGPKALQLSQSYERALDRGDIIGSALERLVSTTGESAFFYIRDGGNRLCLMGRDSPEALRVNSRIGSLIPLDETSISQVLREFDRPDAGEGQQGVLRSSTGIYDSLTASLSAPVFNSSDRLVGALAISGPIGRFDPSDGRAREALLKEAYALSAIFGGQRALRRFPPDAGLSIP